MNANCFCLHWNNYQTSVLNVLKVLLEEGQFVDVTLACDGRRIRAHKIMLSACSNYFRDILKNHENEHPIIFLRDVKFWELESIMDFIYNGKVNVSKDQLPSLIRTAEALQIKGLAAVNSVNSYHGNLSQKCTQQNKVTGKRSFNGKESATVKKKSNACDSVKISSPKKFKKNEMKISKSFPAIDSAKKGNNREVTEKCTADDVRESLPQANVIPRISVASNLFKNDDLQTSLPTASQQSEVDTFSKDSPATQYESDSEGDIGGLQTSAMIYNESGQVVCHVCGKAFRHQGSLVAHFQVHQARTKCPICSKVLSRHYHMKVHLLTVHKVADNEIDNMIRTETL